MMLRDGGQDDRNKRPISDEGLSAGKVGPGEMDQGHAMSISRLLEPTPVDPQRMVHVDKLPLFNAGEGNRDLAALGPLLSATLSDRVAFRPPETASDQRVELLSQSDSTRRPMELEFLPPSKPLATPPQHSKIDQSLGQNAGRSTQLEQWKTRFQQLVEFHKQFHHCCVPLNYPKNPSLAHWVKRQRYQYRIKMKEGKPLTLTDERQEALKKLGFVWDSHAAAWEERWNQLNDFRQLYGHSRVPKNYPPNPPLVCSQSMIQIVCSVFLISVSCPTRLCG